jgi:Flp pilus assembly protein TadG
MEFAMIVPLLFLVLMAVFWFGQAFRIYGTITHAARQGARAAVAPACATCTSTTSMQNAINAINNAMTANHLDPTLIRLPSPPPTLNACTNTSTCVGGGSNTCQSLPGSNVCFQQCVQLSSTAVGGAGTCGLSISFSYQYPFSFKLPCWPQPCTPLDLNNLSIPAQAEMRLESQ